MGQNKANPIDDSFYSLVLVNLKHILVNGFFLADEVRYIYTWSDQKSTSANLNFVMKEDAVLKYFLDIGLIEGLRMENAYRTQELQARKFDINNRVWANWEDVDSAYREYGWVVFIHGINVDKFNDELKKFALKDNGAGLITLNAEAKPSPLQAKLGQFGAHKDGSVSYNDKPIKLNPEQKRLTHALIRARGTVLSYEQLVDILWSEETNTEKYLDSPDRNIKKRIGNLVSEINSNLNAYDSKKHLTASGSTSYKFVP